MTVGRAEFEREPGPRTGTRRGKIQKVGLPEQRAFQEAFARLCTDASLRRRWTEVGNAAFAEFGLALEVEALMVFEGLDRAALEGFAASTSEARWRSVARTVPATARVWPALREHCLASGTRGVEELDEAAAPRSTGLRALLSLRTPLDEQLRHDEALPPWLGDVFSFELERALAREEGSPRELSCLWPAHELALRCVTGEVPNDPPRGAFHYRMVADQLFVKGL